MENGKAVEDLTFTAVATAMHFGESGASGAELNHKYLYQSGNSGTTHQRYASRQYLELKNICNLLPEDMRLKARHEA